VDEQHRERESGVKQVAENALTPADWTELVEGRLRRCWKEDLEKSEIAQSL
jgi:hypothetical protein